MKILFLMIGPVPFKSANFVRNFMKQLDTEEISVGLMAENFTMGYLQPPKTIKLFSMTDNFNEGVFKNLMENTKLDLVVFGNFDSLLFDDTNLAFKKSFFSHIKCPVMFMVTNNNIVFKDNHCFLSDEQNNKIRIHVPFSVLKPCPPFIPDMDNNENDKNVKTHYWKNLETFAFLNKDESNSSIKQKIKASSESKIVSLLLDIEQIGLTINKNLGHHYKILIDCVSYYLSKLSVNCNLVVGNMGHMFMENDYPNVKVVFWGPLLDEDQEQIIRASDLILTESITGAVLVDSANLKIPVINLKSSVTVEKSMDEENKECVDIMYGFEELTEFSQSKVEELLEKTPDGIFPYYAFPNVASVNYDETKVFGHYIFTFSELFDEEGTTQLIKDLLLNTETIKEEVYRIEQYLTLRADADDVQEILEKIE